MHEDLGTRPCIASVDIIRSAFIFINYVHEVIVFGMILFFI